MDSFVCFAYISMSKEIIPLTGVQQNLPEKAMIGSLFT